MQSNPLQLNILKISIVIFIITVMCTSISPLQTSHYLGIIFVLTFLFLNRKIYLNNNLEYKVTYFWFFYFIFISTFNFIRVVDVSLQFSYINSLLTNLILILLIHIFIDTRKKIIILIKYTVILGTVIAILSLSSFVLYQIQGIESIFLSLTWQGDRVRLQGLYNNPNFYSSSLVLSFGLTLGFKNHLSNNKLLPITILIIISLTVFLTFSRGAWVAILVIYLTYSLLIGNKVKSLIKIFIFTIVMIGIYMYLSNFSILKNQFNYALNDLFSGSGSGRIDIWIDGIYIILQENLYFLFGMGGNQFFISNNTGYHPHSGYFGLLFEYGIIGLLVSSVLIIVLLKSTLLSNKNSINFSLFFPLVGFLVLNLTNDYFTRIEFWLIISLILVAKKIKFKEGKNYEKYLDVRKRRENKKNKRNVREEL